jgi:hypothetical protein
MIASIFLVTATLIFASQVMAQSETGIRPSLTLASQFAIPSDQAFTSWPIIDRAIHLITDEGQLWILLILTAAVIYWVLDWIDEKLSILYGRAAPAPVVAET